MLAVKLCVFLLWRWAGIEGYKAHWKLISIPQLAIILKLNLEKCSIWILLFVRKLKVPAWRSILDLAMRSYLGKFARPGVVKGAKLRSHFYGRGILFQLGYFEKIWGREEAKGGTINNVTLSRNVSVESIHPVVRLPSSSSYCSF